MISEPIYFNKKCRWCSCFLLKYHQVAHILWLFFVWKNSLTSFFFSFFSNVFNSQKWQNSSLWILFYESEWRFEVAYEENKHWHFIGKKLVSFLSVDFKFRFLVATFGKKNVWLVRFYCIKSHINRLWGSIFIQDSPHLHFQLLWCLLSTILVCLW